MRGLIQRVSRAQVDVDGQCVGKIQAGLLLLLAVENGDEEAHIEKLVHKVLNYRIFSDENGKMNRSVVDIQGGVLVVSQFTLAADTKKGLRPSFSSAAAPDLAKSMYQRFVDQLQEESRIQVATGIFAADMQVSLINDGPVTFLLEV